MVAVLAAFAGMQGACDRRSVATPGDGGAGGQNGGVGGQNGGAGGQNGGPDSGFGGERADAARDEVSTDVSVPELPLTGAPVASFDTTAAGFVLDTYHDVGTKNLGDPMSGLAMLATLSLDASLGSPTPGSLQVEAPFSGANQYFSLNAPTFSPALMPNWQGAKMHVRARADGGTFHGLIQPFVRTGGMYVFGGTALLFTGNGAWQEVTLDVSNAVTRNPGYDPRQIIDFGIQFSSGAAGAGQRAVTIHVDSFTIELAPDAGP